ncbi:MAG TPA: tyrosine--tRNA ligase, partial [Planctomycetota bacterium]|nr:tyrosine--tRNA ligase [Planctomycetota bacterium]
VGGATGMIGDPSGKSQERNLLSVDDLERNVASIREQMRRFLDFDAGANSAALVNNHDWIGRFSYLEFLRDIGKNFPVNVMLAKDSVKSRLGRDEGNTDAVSLSYTEFSYMLLQAYDFYHLFKHAGCRLQIGGSDQFGNITAGIELIRRKRPENEPLESHHAFGLTTVLITDSQGQKIGKTTGGALWLDPKMTPPYDFYQYWINVGDADGVNYLRYFTDLGREEIEGLEAAHGKDPGQRLAQKKLAAWMTEKVHGVTEREKAEKTARDLFTKPLKELDEAALLNLVKEAPSSTLAKSRLEGEGLLVLDLLVEAPKLWPSKGEAKRSIQGGGANLNNEKITDMGKKVAGADLLHGKYLVLRKGQKNYHLIRVE